MRKFGWATVALFLSVLTACSDDALSSTQPTEPASSPSSSSSTPDPTPDEQTPEEFVRAWVAEYNAMQNSGDTEKFREMSQRCATCRSVADQVEAIYTAGGYVKTKGWTVQSMEISKPDGRQRVSVTIEVNSAVTEVKDSADSPVRILPGGRFVNLLSLNHVDGGWNVFVGEKVAQ